MRERTPGAILKSDRADAAAKRMRRTPTHMERELWKRLRHLPGHFRRQAPFGPYIVDFVSHGLRLIIEIDGPVHDLPGRAEHDATREAWLTARGYRVMRFRDSAGIDAIMEQVLSVVEASAPTPRELTE